MTNQLTEAQRVAYIEARRRGLCHHDAEDVAQEVVTRLWPTIADGTNVQHIPAWTRRTTNLIFDLHRTQQRRKNGSGLIESLDAITESQKFLCEA